MVEMIISILMIFDILYITYLSKCTFSLLTILDSILILTYVFILVLIRFNKNVYENEKLEFFLLLGRFGFVILWSIFIIYAIFNKKT